MIQYTSMTDSLTNTGRRQVPRLCIAYRHALKRWLIFRALRPSCYVECHLVRCGRQN